MQSTVEIDTERPEKLKQILELSLESGDKVNYQLEPQNQKLVINTETNGLGPLRGCTDTVFRLTSLAEKLY